MSNRIPPAASIPARHPLTPPTDRAPHGHRVPARNGRHRLRGDPPGPWELLRRLPGGFRSGCLNRSPYRHPVHTIRLEPEDWPKALDQVHGPQLVVAGPGTGKTEFLVRRAIRLIDAGHASPGQIVVLTFSRRSAAELAGRIGAGLGRGSVGVDASTFHSFAHRLLETHWDGPVGSLLTGPEQVRIVGRLLEAEEVADWPLPFRPLLTSPTFAEEVADFLLRCRERLVGTAELRRLAADRADWRALPGFFDRYDRHLRETGRIDYGTLLVDAIECLTTRGRGGRLRPAPLRPGGRVSGHLAGAGSTARGVDRPTTQPDRRRRPVPVDLLVPGRRGAQHRRVRRTLRSPRHGRMVLARSFRVPAPIMSAALRVVSSGELPGSAGPVEPADHPGRVEAYVFDQQSAEAEWIASEVERLLVEEGMERRRVAVLVRSKRRLLPELSRALERRRIPHDTPDSRLVDHPMIQVVLDLTRAAAWGGLDPARYPGAADEVDRLMRRVLLGPLLAVPVAVERELVRFRRRSAASWSHVLERLPEATTISGLLADPVWATGMTAADGFWRLWTTLEAFRRVATDPASSDDRAALTSFAQALGRQAERDPSLTLLGYAELAEDDDFEATPLSVDETLQRPGGPDHSAPGQGSRVRRGVHRRRRRRRLPRHPTVALPSCNRTCCHRIARPTPLVRSCSDFRRRCVWPTRP
jgi:hypothetical protein